MSSHSQNQQSQNLAALLSKELDNYRRSTLVTPGETRRVLEIHAQLVERQLEALRGLGVGLQARAGA